MLWPGANQLGLSHRQCLELLEGVEDTLNFLTSTLSYLIHADSQKPEPDHDLFAEWKALHQHVFDLGYSLPGSDATTYQTALQTYGQRVRELRPVVDQYRSAQQVAKA